MSAAKTLDRYANQADMVNLTGASYRQIDYWTRKGYLRGLYPFGEGSGHCRYWRESELVVARRMKALADIGLRLDIAHQVARAGSLTVADGSIRIEVAS